MSEANRYWTRFSDAALGVLYPRMCSLCLRIGEDSICRFCKSEIERLDEAVGTGSGAVDYRFCCFVYENRIAQAIGLLKYGRNLALAAPLAEALAERARDVGVVEDRMIVPVPIHWTRRWKRGFNQAEELCKGLGPCADASLLRLKPTTQQAGKDKAARLQMLASAFEARGVQGRDVLLVDDVVTTGATAEACAGALKAAGAASVGLLALAGVREGSY